MKHIIHILLTSIVQSRVIYSCLAELR